MLRMRYHNALIGVAWMQKYKGLISQDDYNNIVIMAKTYKEGDAELDVPATMCGACEKMSYEMGVEDGSIDPTKQPLKTINWANLLAFIQALLPIILQFIQIINPPKPPVPTPTAVAGSGDDEITQG